MSENSNSGGAGSVAAAFILGSALGAATALLAAPKSGKETRDDIASGVNDIKQQLGSKLSEGSEKAKAKLNDAIETTKTVASESSRAAKEAKQRVKEKRTDDNEEDDNE